MTTTIEVENDVFQELQRLAEPLVDSPSSVLRRILGLSSPTQDSLGHSPTDTSGLTDSSSDRPGVPDLADRSQLAPHRSASQHSPTRPRRGSLLAETEYFKPILEALDELGGSAAASRAIDRVGAKLESRFTAADRGLHQSGGVRWRKRTQFARYALVTKGLMRSDSPHGLWEISADGRSFLKQGAGQ